jgi:hypothetical protein
MLRRQPFALPVLVFVAAISPFLCAGNANAQPRRLELPADVSERPGNSSQEDSETKFFDQLRSLFGRFRDGDLDRAFESAQPIQCSALISDNGEWRPVAFFNEDRRLGDWYHSNLDEVKRELSQYIFSGSCSTDRSSIRLVTKFPVMETVRRYNSGRIPLEDIHLNTNPAVVAYFEPRSQIYTFELPYLYLDREKSAQQTVYSLIPQRLEDRPAREVTNHWECKAVRALDVTFQFLICQTWTLPSDTGARRQTRPSFGSSAYFILSDGREASTSVKLSFGNGEDKPSTDSPDTPAPPPATPSPAAPPATAPPDRPVSRTVPPVEKDSEPLSEWQIPESSSRVITLKEQEFRVIFSAQTWANKIGSPQVLLDQKMLGIDAAKPPEVDYCAWQPASAALVSRILAKEPDREVSYALNTTDGDSRSPASLNLEMKTHTGSRLGTLQCFFPRTASAAQIQFSRWVSIVGAHVSIETQR